jgi:hypothetical protein
MPVSWQDLPVDVVELIVEQCFRHAQPSDMLRVGLVSKATWRYTVRSATYWQLFLKEVT